MEKNVEKTWKKTWKKHGRKKRGKNYEKTRKKRERKKRGKNLEKNDKTEKTITWKKTWKNMETKTKRWKKTFNIEIPNSISINLNNYPGLSFRIRKMRIDSGQDVHPVEQREFNSCQNLNFKMINHGLNKENQIRGKRVRLERFRYVTTPTL